MTRPDLEAIAARAAAAAVKEVFEGNKMAGDYRDDVLALLAYIEELEARLEPPAPKAAFLCRDRFGCWYPDDCTERCLVRAPLESSETR